MSKSVMNLQDSFLNQVRRENSDIRIQLCDGTVLEGLVKGFDNFTIVLHCEGNKHLIYKHAVAQLIVDNSAEIVKKKNGDAKIENDTPPEKKKDKEKAFNPIDLSTLKVEK